MAKLKKGMKFERFELLYLADERTNDGHTKWWCLCDCQKGKENPELTLITSRKFESIVKNQNGYLYCKNCPKNTYDLSGEYGIGYTAKGEEFYFDLEDYDLIKDYSWSISYGYVVAPDYTRMHRLVLGITDSNIKVDHIKHITYDNRKSQLRIGNHQETMMNHKKPINNTSGCTGVRWHKRDEIWEAYITVNFKQIYLGRFENYNDAVKARKEAEEKYFGEWSYDNSQKHEISKTN